MAGIPRKAGIASQALIVGFDGAPSEAVQQASTPCIDRMLESGSYTWNAQTILPTWTLQSFVSILAGVRADDYELLSDPEGWLEPRRYPVPSLFEVAHEAGLRTGMFNNWLPLDGLPRPGTVDRIFSSEEDSAAVTREASEYLLRDKPELCFVHFDDPDHAGHKHGWRSDRQCAAVARCDGQLGMLLGALAQAGTLAETVVLVVSDHAGGKITDFAHGTEDPTYSHPLVTTVPWICCGPGVKQGCEIGAEVSVRDTAPTVAFLLGLTIPESWQGKVLRDALQDDTKQ